MPLNPNFAAQRLSYYWFGPAYYDGLAVAFKHRIAWGAYPEDSRVHLVK